MEGSSSKDKKRPVASLLPSKLLKLASYSLRLTLAKVLTRSLLSYSVKFGRKVQYVNYLHELRQHMELDQLPIPNQVKE